MISLHRYMNGNADVEIFDDGTRIIQFEDVIELDYPLNIDIRVSNQCPFGYNPVTKRSVCGFCHESARIDGNECDYNILKDKLKDLPKDIELAIGGNNITTGLVDFLYWCKGKSFICNLTVNQLQIGYDTYKMLVNLLKNDVVHGLGVSYRKDHHMNGFVLFLSEFPNVVLHVIAGIDDVDDVLRLPFQKILVLGYKKFGLGIDYYNDSVEKNIQEWHWWVKKLIDNKKVVSFDNLALEQLNIKRFLTDEKWEEFNQGEHSMYINAVNGYFAPSSRSDLKCDWNTDTIQSYFKEKELKNLEI